MSLSRFQGALVGAVIGDCIGSHFEGAPTVKMSEILAWCVKLTTAYKEGKKGFVRFTDDTAMARSVMQSLKEHKGFNAKDMATRFTEEYFKEMDRGYGGSVRTVFRALTEPGLKDVFQPAREQFDGAGSYGNGGAMRIAPAPLFAFQSKENPAYLEKLATDITLLTHTHHLAIKGAILQAFAVYFCLRLSQEDHLDCDKFCDDLLSIMRPIETHPTNDSLSPPKQKQPKSKQSSFPSFAPLKRLFTFSRELEVGSTPYCAKIEKIKTFVKEKDLKTRTVEKVLGNDVSAVGSVPAAVLAFLRGATCEIEHLEEDNPFKRVILYAISLGGDTDTIATMAGAMAGAYFGLEEIPEEWRYVCEGVEDAMGVAESFSKFNNPDLPESSPSPVDENSHL